MTQTPNDLKQELVGGAIERALNRMLCTNDTEAPEMVIAARKDLADLRELVEAGERLQKACYFLSRHSEDATWIEFHAAEGEHKRALAACRIVSQS